MSEKYEFIGAEYATLPAEGDAPTVVQMCEWLGVSKSGFYDWQTRPESEASQRRELLKIKIKALFEANNEEYGYRRIHAALVRGGESVDDETVRKIMRDLGLEPCQPKPWRFSLTEQDGQAGPIPDLVNRDFTADKPGRKWSAISPTSTRGKAGFISRRSSTARPGRSSAGRWMTITRPR